MKIFISGGCKNGKSHYAQRLAKAQRPAQGPAQQAARRTDLRLNEVQLYYIATMKSVDGEDEERIARHRREREGWGFTTIEQPFDIEKILDKCDVSQSFLLDSLTALLANEMFTPDGRGNEGAAQKITDGLLLITDKIKNIVIVSDYIYSDALFYEPLTEKYRESLARIDRAAVENCDVVLEIAYSNIIVHRGREVFSGLYEKII